MNKLPLDAFMKEAFKRNKSAQTHRNVHLLAVELIKRCYNEDVFIVFTDGLRTLEDQAVIYGKGRASFIYNGKQYGNPKVKSVTRALPGDSMHNYGLALDFVTCDGFGKGIDWNVGPKWKRAAAIAKELGFSWGGDWKSFYDAPHIEYNGGLSITQIKRGKFPTFKVVSSINIDKDKGALTVSQYNELKVIIDAQAKVIAALQAEVKAKADAKGNTLGGSYEEAWFWAKEQGLLNGENPQGPLTRQQAAIVLKRFYALK